MSSFKFMMSLYSMQCNQPRSQALLITTCFSVPKVSEVERGFTVNNIMHMYSDVIFQASFPGPYKNNFSQEPGNDARVRYLSMKLVRFTFLFSCRE